MTDRYSRASISQLVTEKILVLLLLEQSGISTLLLVYIYGWFVKVVQPTVH